MTKEDWDLIWALVKSSEAVGYHGARLDTEEQIEAFTEAFQERQDLFGKVLRRLNGATLLRMLCCVAALYFVIQRRWE